MWLCCVRLKLIPFLCFVLSTWNQNLKRNSVTYLESYLFIFVIMPKDKLNTRLITGKETVWPTRGHWWYCSLILPFISQKFLKYHCSGNGCLRSDIRVVVRVNAWSCLVMVSFGLYDEGFVPCWDWKFSAHHCIQTRSVAHSASFSVGTSCFHRGKAAGA